MSSTEDKTDENQTSLFTASVISFGALSGGFVAGTLWQFRKSNFKLNFRKHHSDIAFASRALLAGSALCFGTFGVLASVFMFTTGVSSFVDLKYFMKSIATGTKVNGPSEDLVRYKKVTANMTFSEECDYLYKLHIAPHLNSTSTEESNTDDSKSSMEIEKFSAEEFHSKETPNLQSESEFSSSQN
mmetsp:Transcript_16693/g.25092  ORF Transcript_16693/g.25092 Transcript_16693/m.25092 type:complete len:186 (+) Transcript_16693:54-611(+)